MAPSANRFRKPKPEPKKPFLNPNKAFNSITNWINEKLSIEDKISTDVIMKLFWCTGLVICYIFFQNNYERQIRSLDKVRAKMNESKASYITYKSTYLFDSKQSEVEEKLKTSGLTKNNQAPIKIKINP